MSFQKRCSDELTNDPGMLTTVVSNKHLNEKQTTNHVTVSTDVEQLKTFDTKDTRTCSYNSKEDITVKNEVQKAFYNQPTTPKTCEMWWHSQLFLKSFCYMDFQNGEKK